MTPGESRTDRERPINDRFSPLLTRPNGPARAEPRDGAGLRRVGEVPPAVTAGNAILVHDGKLRSRQPRSGGDDDDGGSRSHHPSREEGEAGRS
jgi:hypothetical protein